MSVRVSGLDDFDRVAQRVRASCETAVRDTVTAIRIGAKSRVPKDTGATERAIAGSVERKDERIVGKVWLGDVRHAKQNWPAESNFGMWLEYGTRYRRATPFLTPAADAERTNYTARLAEAVERATHGA